MSFCMYARKLLKFNKSIPKISMFEAGDTLSKAHHFWDIYSFNCWGCKPFPGDSKWTVLSHETRPRTYADG